MKNLLIGVLALCAVLTIGAIRPTGAQTPSFEVASVKPNRSGPGPQRLGFAPGGRFTATNVPVRDLISIAYGQPQPLANFQIIGGPGWITSDRFDISAKAEGDPQP